MQGLPALQTSQYLWGKQMGWTQEEDRISVVEPVVELEVRSTPPKIRNDELVLTEYITPELANHYGTLFAPNALALLGKAACFVAARYTRQAVVMTGVNQVGLIRPVRVGALLALNARVTRVGRSSMSVRVVAKLDEDNGPHGVEMLRGEFELIVIDEAGLPTPVNPPSCA